MDLHTLYTHLRETAFAQLKAGHAALDPLLDSANDRRRGLTLLARPQSEVRQKLQELLQELAQLEPEQYYYPIEDLHITLLSLISCYPGFTLAQIDPLSYTALVEKALRDIPAFRVEFSGLTASPSCVMAQGFPEGEAISQLRHNLRTLFQASPLQQSIDQRYTLQTAHCTLVRFRRPLSHPMKFLEKLQEYQAYAFGVSWVQEVELVYNDWYQRQAETKVIHTFQL